MLEFLREIRSNYNFKLGWIKYRSQATMEDLRYVISEGDHKGKTGLWFLANEVDEDCVKDLMALISEKKITVDDLLCKAENGDDKGKSVLWLLVELALLNFTEPFMAIWEQYKSVLKVEHFLTLFEPLIDGVRVDVLAPFNVVWNHFKEKISIEQILNRGNHFSLFWSLALIADKLPEPIVWILNQHSEKITLQDLLEKKAGKSILMLAAESVACGKPEPFAVIWRLYKHQLKLEHFLDEVDGTADIGHSTLFVLAFAAYDHPGSFITVWNHFKHQITLPHLLRKAQDGVLKGKCTLQLMQEASLRSHPLKKILCGFLSKHKEVLLPWFERFKAEGIFLKPAKVEPKKSGRVAPLSRMS